MTSRDYNESCMIVGLFRGGYWKRRAVLVKLYDTHHQCLSSKNQFNAAYQMNWLSPALINL